MQPEDESTEIEYEGPSRYSIFLVIVGCYLLPLIFITLFKANKISHSINWNIFSVGLLLAFIGSFILFYFMCQWADGIQVKEYGQVLPSQPTDERHKSDNGNHDKLIELQSKHSQLVSEMHSQTQVVEQLRQEKEHFQQHSLSIQKEWETYASTMQEQQQQREQLLSQCQNTISEQRTLIEKQHEQILTLEERERDLTYEIKTLLHYAPDDTIVESDIIAPFVADTVSSPRESFANHTQHDMRPSTPPPAPHFDTASKIPVSQRAAHQLQRCQDIATKMTGANAFNHEFLSDLPVDHFALDLRRLCDTLRMESTYPTLLYSQKDNKILYVTDQIQMILGWSPEQFIQDFPDILSESFAEWKKNINLLSSQPDLNMRLLIKARSGQTVPYHCHLGAVHSGLFRHHIMAVLYPV